MNSFTLPITRAHKLTNEISAHFLILDRKAWNRPIEVENTCNHCGKPLTMISDQLIGIEWVCENRSCPGR